MRILYLGWLLLCSLSLASEAHSEVRDLSADERTIHHLRLMMGRSTVVRLPEKPVKIILGNQNYFSVEFSGRDLAIQALARQSSNLFVYTATSSYGFVLEVGGGPPYDDLLVVGDDPSNLQDERGRRGAIQIAAKSPIFSSSRGKLFLHEVSRVGSALVLDFNYVPTGQELGGEPPKLKVEFTQEPSGFDRLRGETDTESMNIKGFGHSTYILRPRGEGRDWEATLKISSESSLTTFRLREAQRAEK